LEIRDICNIAVIVVTVKHIDMIILHGSSSIWRL
jgi:hypothetical protein